MSPEAKARIARVVQQTWKAASAPPARGAAPVTQEAATNYALSILENVVETEVQSRLAARDGG